MKTINLELLKSFPLPDYSDDASKKTRGKLLLIGGSRRIPGAAILAAKAALRSGCGSVRLAAPESVALHIGIAIPELMVIPLPETTDGTISPEAIDLIAAQCKFCDAAVIGPGLDENEQTDAFAREVINMAPLPLLVDASAISALDAKFESGKAARIFTPHEVEFEALSGKKVGDDKEKVAHDWAKKSKAILALKGATTVISDGNESYQTEGETRVLGTAGSGDVLAGIIGSLLAQGVKPLDATIWGVQFHHYIGEEFQKEGSEDGVLARDFIDRLPSTQKYYRRSASEKKSGGFGLRK
jgi:ADP-dependent NAD(P)H-hydrate dehydratase